MATELIEFHYNHLLPYAVAIVMEDDGELHELHLDKTDVLKENGGVVINEGVVVNSVSKVIGKGRAEKNRMTPMYTEDQLVTKKALRIAPPKEDRWML